MERESARSNTERKPTFKEAAAVTALCAFIISYGVLKLGCDAHIPIVFSAVIVAFYGALILKQRWKDMEEAVISGITMSMQAVLILMMVGLIVGSWIHSGVVPSLIYYGLNILSPKIFLLATLVITSVVSLATGSSWGTSGTVGIALMGVGAGLGIPAPVTAGIIISGAYFGDKLSPLSDTTNLAPAVAGSDLFSHIGSMVWTTAPTYLIVVLISLYLGNKYSGGSLDASRIYAIQAVMSGEFHISLMGLIPPILVIGLAIFKAPALPGLIAGILLASAMSIFQGSSIADVVKVLHYGYSATVSASLAEAGSTDALFQIMTQNGITGVRPMLAKEAGSMLSELLTRGGMDSMMWTISLIIAALTLGGVMEQCGFLEVLLKAILNRVQSVGGIVASVIGSCFLTNVFLGDQYLAIVMPGRMFKRAFDEKGLQPELLSRSLEDSGTLTSVLVPWNTCGAYHASVLGVSTLAYAPYAFFNYINPLVAIAMAYMAIKIPWQDGRNPKAQKQQPQP